MERSIYPDATALQIPLYEFAPAAGAEEAQIGLSGDVIGTEVVWVAYHECERVDLGRVWAGEGLVINLVRFAL